MEQPVIPVIRPCRQSYLPYRDLPPALQFLYQPLIRHSGGVGAAFTDRGRRLQCGNSGAGEIDINSTCQYYKELPDALRTPVH